MSYRVSPPVARTPSSSTPTSRPTDLVEARRKTSLRVRRLEEALIIAMTACLAAMVYDLFH